jgi:hypothetical protein
MGNNSFQPPSKRNENSYCFISGSFAHSAPSLERPTSDIDVQCSEDFSEEEVRLLVQSRFPGIKSDVTFDIIRQPLSVTKPIIYGVHYYFKDFKTIELYPHPKLEVRSVADKSFSSTLRDPDKTQFYNYIRTTNWIEFFQIRKKDGPLELCTSYFSGTYNKSVERYGSSEYLSAISNLPEEKIYKALHMRGFEMNQACKKEFDVFRIDREQKLVSGRNSQSLTYDSFYEKCLHAPVE